MKNKKTLKYLFFSMLLSLFFIPVMGVSAAPASSNSSTCKYNCESKNYTISYSNFIYSLAAVGETDGGGGNSANTPDESSSTSTPNGTPLETVSCGGMDIPSQLLIFSRAIFLLIQVAVPVILIIMGMLDFAKATIGSDEAAIKEARGKFTKRLIAGAIVFLVFVIIKLVIVAFPTGASDTVTNCFECFIKDTGNC